MLKRTLAMMEEKREAVAAELLAWPNIEAEIRAAAGAGQTRVVLAPAAAIRFRHTAAAAAAIDKLTRERFRTTWSDHRPTSTGPAGDQLEIEWTAPSV